MKPRRLKNGSIVIPVLESGGMLNGGSDVLSIGLQVLSPEDPQFPAWQKYLTGAPSTPATPEPAPQEVPQEVAEPKVEKSEYAEAMDLIKAEKHTGIMIALFLPPDAAKQLDQATRDAGLGEYAEPISNSHITLLYLGKTDETTIDKDYLLMLLQQWALFSDIVVSGKVSGYGRFNNNEGGDINAVYASFDSLDLIDLREDLIDVVTQSGYEPEFTHGFTPHITLAYVPTSVDSLRLRIPSLEISFEEVVLAWGGEQHRFRLCENK